MDKIRIFALGGLDENGKNLYVVEVNDEMILLEAGIKYPETDQLGVQAILPDFSYLIQNKNKIRGLFISHAHDDVMDACLPLIKQINIPIYTTTLPAAFLKKSFADHQIRDYKINIIKRSDEMMVGNLKVKTFALTQSIMDGFGVAIGTDQGYIVYCGEFLFDLDNRMPSFSCDLSEMAEIGKEKVFALMCESNRADSEGYTSPKHQITKLIEPHISDADGRIIVSCFEQNIYRIIEILNLAVKYHKKVLFYSDELRNTLKEIEELGYYKFPGASEVYRSTFSNEIKDIIIIVSGQGPKVFEYMMKIATGEDDLISLKDDDTIIIASPSNSETEVDGSNMKNELYKDNVKIVSLDGRKTTSMHASIEDIKMMLYLFKPIYYIPIKGEYRHLIANANVALDMGYLANRIVVLDNGQIATFENGNLRSTSDLLELDEVMVGDNPNSDISSFVLKDRELLSKDGVIVIGIVLNFNTKEIIGGPDVQSRGFIYIKEADYIIKEAGNILIETIEEFKKENRYDNLAVRAEAKERITRYLLKETGKHPMILPAIVEINLSE